jgi:surfeit locus 1 family protein
MHRRISLFGLKFELVPFIFVITSFFILVSLGNWQLSRLSQKKYFIQTIENNIENPALNIEKINPNIPHYSKIELEGKFEENKNVFLYGRRSASPEKDGYYLLSPFKTINGDVLLVSRGWIPQSSKNKFEDYTQKDETIKITGIVLPHEEKNFFVPGNDKEKNIWFNIDLFMAKDILETNVTNFYLMQIDSHDLPIGGKALSTTHLNKVRNDHMEYAITWYSLGACLLVLFLIYGRKQDDSEIN